MLGCLNVYGSNRVIDVSIDLGDVCSTLFKVATGSEPGYYGE